MGMGARAAIRRPVRDQGDEPIQMAGRYGLKRKIGMQTEVLRVTGMTCGGCSANVTQTLKAVSGVRDVKVSLAAGEAIVIFDEQKASFDALRSALQRAGYGLGVSAAPTPVDKSCCDP